jgi:hypothetical protein
MSQKRNLNLTRLDETENKMSEQKRRFDDHLDPEDLEIKSVLKAVHSIHNAFPDGDLEGHCKYHEAVIAAKKAEEKFWTELKLDLAKKGSWGLLIILIGLVMSGMVAKFGFTVIQK